MFVSSVCPYDGAYHTVRVGRGIGILTVRRPGERVRLWIVTAPEARQCAAQLTEWNNLPTWDRKLAHPCHQN
jgi:hypothetical protein